MGECPDEIKDLLRDGVSCGGPGEECSGAIVRVGGLGGRDCLGYLGSWSGQAIKPR